MFISLNYLHEFINAESLSPYWIVQNIRASSLILDFRKIRIDMYSRNGKKYWLVINFSCWFSVSQKSMKTSNCHELVSDKTNKRLMRCFRIIWAFHQPHLINDVLHDLFYPLFYSMVWIHCASKFSETLTRVCDGSFANHKNLFYH